MLSVTRQITFCNWTHFPFAPVSHVRLCSVGRTLLLKFDSLSVTSNPVLLDALSLFTSRHILLDALSRSRLTRAESGPRHVLLDAHSCSSLTFIRARHASRSFGRTFLQQSDVHQGGGARDVAAVLHQTRDVAPRVAEQVVAVQVLGLDGGQAATDAGGTPHHLPHAAAHVQAAAQLGHGGELALVGEVLPVVPLVGLRFVHLHRQQVGHLPDNQQTKLVHEPCR